MRAEIVVIVIGLIVGYCLVNYLMSRGTSSGANATRAPDADNGRGSGWSDAGPEAHRATAAAAPGPRWFEVLGVAESADRQELERAYRFNVSQYHPDKVARLGEDIRRLAEERSKAINAAYDEGLRRAAR